MAKRKKVLISLVAFVLIFGGLLAISTYKDLEISRFLTRNTLAGHTYTTNSSVFGIVVETIGCSPVFLLAGFALHIIFWYGLRIKKGALGITVAVVSALISVADYYVLTSDTYGYLKGHLSDTIKEAISDYITIICGLLAVILTLIGTMAVKKLSDGQLKKLFRFAVACLIIAAVPTILIDYIIKEPVGRIRFRAMNMYPDNPEYGFAAFAKWYEINGQWLSKETMRELFHTTDALMSFPSGHTAGAGTSFGIVMLIDALNIRSKKAKAILWTCPVFITCCVALGRMLVGAHFLSDVLFGGAISFVTMIITREICICKGSNVKALTGNKH